MCGRFNLYSSPTAVADLFGLVDPPDAKPRYNVAPTQIIVTIRAADGQRQAIGMRWGLIPSWSQGPDKGGLFNARAETAAEKPAFRAAFKQRRCLIPADGFFEWKKLDKKQKQPLYFRAADDSLLAFAGLWETWTTDEGKPMLSCTILTTEAGDDVKEIHDRMPAIIGREHFDAWLNPTTPEDQLKEMLRPLPAGSLHATPVSNVVNSARCDTPECIQPAESQGIANSLF